MDYQQIRTEQDGQVLTITLNRPERLNAWTQTMEDEFRHAVDAAAIDESVRAIVVTGAGRGFCAGADMSELAAGASGETQISQTPAKVERPRAGDFEANYQHRFSWLLRIPKPVFVAINGPIAGIGLCMTLYCDFRYMAPGQKLTTAFASRGLIAEHGSSWMLSRLIGLTNTLDLLLSARKILTEEAAQMGLVRMLPAEGFLAAVQKIAADMTTYSSPRSIGVMKRQIYDALLQNMDQAWRAADEQMLKSFECEDFREGVAHFVEKREPRFTGR